ncbi:unnamed protein product [Ectocarpus sp. 8 AP-2014]
MPPHSGQRATGQTLASTGGRGLKRKAPNTPAGKAVASADPARLHGKTTTSRKPPPTSTGAKGGDKGKGSKPVEEGTGKGKAKGKVKGDIDDIFAGVKRLKEEKAEEEAARVAKKKKIKEDHKRRQANPFTGEGGPDKRWAWADEVKPVRFDDEGLPIYTWASLRIGQGGGTAACPFDCDCCF